MKCGGGLGEEEEEDQEEGEREWARGEQRGTAWGKKAWLWVQAGEWKDP